MRMSLRFVVLLLALTGFAGVGNAATYEPNVDRTGGDYTSLNLPAGSNAQSCRSLCDADGNCRAWTYVKAGVQAANPRCWLKNTVPPPHASACCTSGVK